ncbi:hypothetical protein KMC43_gp18 [Ralstonia phage Raharianne]|uniref:Uncharacterized protein n=2 Tax=Rahariannevirus raharianne TaxID=2846050 RepID=A0A7G5BBB4_9CAUD|nr:hypothetical protein KMC43_gp18 [Ralstonia phage Raharianne]QMV32393.1 hypothetical protein U2_00018 [Ralstonia phage Albius]QMV33587.1 hypothetical protein Y2_00018 [Ralstonia phage Raharianne]
MQTAHTLNDIKSIADARVWYINSGFYNWEWFDGFSEVALLAFAYRHGADCASEDDLVRAFLLASGQNPADYGL